MLNKLTLNGAPPQWGARLSPCPDPDAVHRLAQPGKQTRDYDGAGELCWAVRSGNDWACDQTEGEKRVSCDHCAIKNLIYHYAHHIDDADLDDVAATFHRGRIVAVDGQGRDTPIVGAQAVLALYRSFTRIYEDNATPHTLHLTSNVLVELGAQGDRASAKSYAMVFQALDTFPLQPIIGVRYYDEFVRAGAGWRFAERRIDTHLVGDLSRHLLHDSPRHA